jgi:SAM-dependent methyltransferase
MQSEPSPSIINSAAHWREVNLNKYSFEKVYNAQWPHSYYAEHRRFDYQIPQNAQAGISAIVEEIRKGRRIERAALLDVGCSYGINGLLLKKQIDLETLYRAYLEPNGLLGSQDLQAHTRYCNGLKDRRGIQVIGLDTAEAAVRYGLGIGALDHGIVCDLESEDTAIGADHLPLTVDLIISTGCIGYVSERTFARLLRLLACQRQEPWVLSYVMRPFPYSAIARCLAGFGLLTLRLPQYCSRQRRFSCLSEREALLAKMHDLRLDDSPERATGYIHADCYLSVPADEARVLARLVAQTPADQGQLIFADS